MNDISERKNEHIQFAAMPDAQMDGEGFERYRLPYRAFPELALGDVDTSVQLLGKRLSQPLIIASMSGGSEHARAINTHLAVAAEANQVALGVGSQRIALENTEAEATFRLVRELAPTTVLFANMGAVQLNYGRDACDYQRVIDMIQADGLYLHVNPLQEALQPGGDTNFAGLLRKLEMLVRRVSVPVFVKEVGHGIDPRSAKQVIECGVAGIDVAGTGGTSWAWIESQRAENAEFAEWFKDFGWPTDVALKELQCLRSTAPTLQIVASGGIRNPLQALKAHILGADYYSVASTFLQAALRGADEVSTLLTRWQKGLQIGMFCLGVDNWQKARECGLSAS